MKKILSVFVILTIVFNFVGCCINTSVDNSMQSFFDFFFQKKDQPSNGMKNNDIEELEPVEGEKTDPQNEETQVTYEQEETEPKEDDTIFIDSNTQYKINLFLSNFAEARIRHYPCCDYHKLRFVISHCEINGVGDLEYAHNDVFFSKATADSILNKYTGTTVKEYSEYNQHLDCTGSGSTITFSENFYYCSAAAGAPCDYVAVVDRMCKNNDGTYTVKFQVYTVLPTYGTYDYSDLYKYTPTDAANSEHLSVEYFAEAVVQDYVRPNGQESYQLLLLKVVE